MQNVSIKSLAVAIALLITMAAAHGQSLGDVARETREAKEKADNTSATQPKVITNNDLLKDPEQTEDETASVASEAPTNLDQATAGHSSQQHQRLTERKLTERKLAEQRAAEQWKRQVVAQKHKLVNLQARIDQLNASIKAANGTTQYEGPNGRGQARQLERIAEIQLQLDEEKRTLVEMQEAARQAGMHTPVYDP
jgi:hypothetical protein